jgi:hypothetical protein
MLIVSRLWDLQQFGIVPLTGESDRLSFRVLCDVTEEGRSIVSEAFGLRPECFPESWNSSSSSGDHVGSVLLYDWRQIGIIALVRRCRHVLVLERDFGLIGLVHDGEDEAFLPAEHRWNDQTGEFDEVAPHRIRLGDRVYPWSSERRGRIVRVFSDVTGSLRNEHQMSGRLD